MLPARTARTRRPTTKLAPVAITGWLLGVAARSARPSSPTISRFRGMRGETQRRMEAKTGEVHVLRLAGTVQNGQDVLNFLEVIGADAFGFPVLEEPFEALMPEALDHMQSYR